MRETNQIKTYHVSGAVVLHSQHKRVQFATVLFQIENADIDINDAGILESERNSWKDLIADQTTNRKVGILVLMKY